MSVRRLAVERLEHIVVAVVLRTTDDNIQPIVRCNLLLLPLHLHIQLVKHEVTNYF